MHFCSATKGFRASWCLLVYLDGVWFGLSIACATYSMETAKFFTAAGMVWSTVWMFAITLIVFRKSDNYRLEH